MLMMSGFDKYYQIAKCFRDEDLRADRQPEFTQLDIECAFFNEDQIMELSESLMKKIFKSLIDDKISLTFPRITFKEAILKFGCDKPTLETTFLVDIANYLQSTEFKVFKDCVDSPNSRIAALKVPEA